MVKRSKTYLRPGWIVVGGVSMRGCTSYSTSERQESVKDNRLDGEWHTHKVVRDIDEERRAKTVQMSSRRKLAALGSHVTGMGYITPSENGVKLLRALREIERDCKHHNKDAAYTNVSLDVTMFQVRADDERLAATLYQRIADTLKTIHKAMASGNVRAVRMAVKSLISLDGALPAEHSSQLTTIVASVRADARNAIKAMKDVSESKKVETAIRAMNRRGLSGARAEFVEVARTARADAESAGYQLPRSRALPSVQPRSVELPPRKTPEKKGRKT